MVQNELQINRALRRYEYAVIPTDGIIDVVQDELGFVRLKVGVCKENWQTGQMIKFVNRRDSFKGEGEQDV